VGFEAPTDGEIIPIPPGGQSGPVVTARVTFRAQWKCEMPPPDTSLTWTLFDDGSQVDTATVEVDWTGRDGEVVATPGFTPDYVPEAGQNSFNVTYKITATQNGKDREATVRVRVDVEE
jgi:Tfp pilus assembly protein PilX